MIMLSQLNQFQVVDQTGKQAKLADLALAVLEEDHPPVTRIYIENEGAICRLDWTAILSLDPKTRRMTVRDLLEAVECELEAPESEVLVNQDILDALIIDLKNRTTTRANDLQFSFAEDSMLLNAVDTGWRAIFRRVTKGKYTKVKEATLADWKYIEFLRGDPAAVHGGAGYIMRIGRLPAGEIAMLADYLPYLHVAELVMLLPDPKAADVLEAMTVSRQLQVFEELDPKVALNLLKRMESDHAADLLGRLNVSDLKMFLQRLPADQSERITQLLRFPEGSVGGVMVNNLLTVTPKRLVEEVREELQERIHELDLFSMAFVIDEENGHNLLGVVTLEDLIGSRKGETIEEIMNPFIETLQPFDAAVDAAYRIVSSQKAAMPVTDSSGKLVGAMSFVAAIPYLAPETSTLRTVRVFS